MSQAEPSPTTFPTLEVNIMEEFLDQDPTLREQIVDQLWRTTLASGNVDAWRVANEARRALYAEAA